MKLRSIVIRQLPGLPKGLSLPDRLGQGLVFICGANGIGKSSIVRALRHLLFPGAADPQVSVSGTFGENGGATYEADANGGQAIWRNGRPGLPDQTALDAHIISADLIAAAADIGVDLTQEILRQAAGGFDANATRAAMPAAPQPNQVQVQVNAARQAVTEAERGQQALVATEAGLDERRKLRDEMIDELKLELPMQQTLQLARDREALAEARSEEQAFPAPVRLMKDGDDQLLKRIANDIEGRTADIETAQKAIDEANEQIRQTGLDEDHCPAQAQVEAATKAAGEAADAERLVAIKTGDYAAARAALRQAAAGLGPDTPADDTPLPDATQQDLHDAATAWTDWRRSEARGSALAEALTAVPSHAADDAQPARTALAALLRWLGAQPAGQAGAPGGPSMALAIALAVVAVCGLVVAVVLREWAALAAVVVAGVMAYVAYTRRPQPAADTGASVRQQAEAEIANSGLGVPPLTPVNVAEVLGKVTDILASRTSDAAIKTTLDLVRQGLQSKADQAGAEQESARSAWDSVSGRTGLHLHQPNAPEICRWSQVLVYLQAQVAMAVADAALATAQGELKAHVAGVVRAIEAAWPGRQHSITTATDAETWAAALRDAADQYRRAVEVRIKAGEVLKEARGKLAAAQTELQEFLDARKLDSTEEFGALWPSYPAIVGVRGRIKQLVDSIDKLADGLKEFPGLLDLNIEEAQQRLDSLADTKAKLDGDGLGDKGLRGAIVADEERIRIAKEGNALALLQQQLADLEAELEARTQAYLRRQAQEKVLDLVTARAEQQRPEVLEIANETFGRITAGRYTMRIEDQQIWAYDTEQEKRYATADLSTGTRMQMLLCVRLAYAEKMSGGVRLPIFIDEALCMTDDGRVEQASAVLASQVKDGRQVFYLSSDNSDYASMVKAMAAAGIPDQITRLDLPYQEGASQPSLPEPPLRALIPAPGGMTAVEYAPVLGAGKLDPNSPAGSAHLVYACYEDLATLHRLASDGVTTVGQFTTLGESGLRTYGVPVEATKRVAPGVATVRAFVEAWQAIGDDLDEKDVEGLTGLRANAVRRCADEVGWNRALIIECLNRRMADLDGIGRGAIDAIEQHLQAARRRRLAAITLDQIQGEVIRLYTGDPRPDGALPAHIEWLFSCVKAQSKT